MVMNNDPSGANTILEAAIPRSKPSATKMSRTSVSAPASRRPRASATVTPSVPSTTIDLEYVR